MRDSKFENIDLVIVNFYPFELTVEKTKNHNQIIENIDVGGPTMVRAAAKNYENVTVITKLEQYEKLIQELKQNKGSTSFGFRQNYLRKHLQKLHHMMRRYLITLVKKIIQGFSNKKVITANLVETLRYGENSHQNASIYSLSNSINLKQISGKKLSYNNYNDIYAALNIQNHYRITEDQ